MNWFFVKFLSFCLEEQHATFQGGTAKGQTEVIHRTQKGWQRKNIIGIMGTCVLHLKLKWSWSYAAPSKRDREVLPMIKIKEVVCPKQTTSTRMTVNNNAAIYWHVV